MTEPGTMPMGVFSDMESSKKSSFSHRVYSIFRYRWPFSWVWFLLYLVTGKVRRVPVNSLTNLGAFSYSQTGWHPFNAALKQLDRDPDICPRDSILTQFYDRSNRNTQDGYLPVHSEDGWQSTKTCYLPPWRGGKNVNFDDTFEHWTGPKSEEAVAFLFNRLKSMYHRLRSEGYRPLSYPDGFIRVCVLERSKGNRRCLVVGGQNRAAIISHLRHDETWVRIQQPSAVYPGNMPSVIKLSETDRWERVVQGEFTNENASRFFDAYFKYDGKAQATALGLL